MKTIFLVVFVSEQHSEIQKDLYINNNTLNVQNVDDLTENELPVRFC